MAIAWKNSQQFWLPARDEANENSNMGGIGAPKALPLPKELNWLLASGGWMLSLGFRAVATVGMAPHSYTYG